MKNYDQTTQSSLPVIALELNGFTLAKIRAQNIDCSILHIIGTQKSLYPWMDAFFYVAQNLSSFWYSAPNKKNQILGG